MRGTSSVPLKRWVPMPRRKVPLTVPVLVVTKETAPPRPSPMTGLRSMRAVKEPMA